MNFFKTRRFRYSFIVTFFLFPVLLPVWGAAGIPCPNIIFLFFSLIDFSDFLNWYLKTWMFVLPSFAITFLIIYLISHVVVYKNRHLYKWNKK